MKKNIFLFLIFLTLASCSSIVITKNKNIEKPKKVVLISTLIGHINRPYIPILFASKFNNKTNLLAKDLNSLKSQNIENYRDILAKKLQENMGCEVIYGNTLTSLEGFKNLKSIDNPSNLTTDDEYFPKIIAAKNDINPFPFKNGKVAKYFSQKNDHKEIITKICTKLNTEYLVVSYSELSITEILTFGNKAKADLETYILLFHKDGELVSEGFGHSNEIKTSGDQIKDYEFLINQFEPAIDNLTKKMNKSFKNK